MFTLSRVFCYTSSSWEFGYREQAFFLGHFCLCAFVFLGYQLLQPQLWVVKKEAKGIHYGALSWVWRLLARQPSFNPSESYVCFMSNVQGFQGFPGGRGKESTCKCRRWKRSGFCPWIGKIPWKRKWQTTSIFLPEKFNGQRSLVGYSPSGGKESDMTEHTHTPGFSVL